MNLLAAETSTVACSVALLCADKVTERREERPRQHTRLLIPMVRDLVRESGLEISDMDAFVFGNGPGSFIGLRIAASLIQGLAFASSRPVIAVSSMLAVAAEAASLAGDGPIVVAQDARMNDVYLGRYQRDGDRMRALDDECLWDRDRPIPAESPYVAAGSAWHELPDFAERNRAQLSALSDVRYPSARWLLPEARCRYADGELSMPAALEPSYLRDQVARAKAR